MAAPSSRYSGSTSQSASVNGTASSTMTRPNQASIRRRGASTAPARQNPATSTPTPASAARAQTLMSFTETSGSPDRPNAEKRATASGAAAVASATAPIMATNDAAVIAAVSRAMRAEPAPRRRQASSRLSARAVPASSGTVTSRVSSSVRQTNTSMPNTTDMVARLADA